MVTITIKIFHFHHPKTSLTAPGNHQSALFILDQFCTFYNVIYVESYCRYSCFCLLFSLCIHLCCCEFIHSFFSFSLQCSIPIYRYTTKCPFFIQSSVDGLLRAFQLLVTMNKIAMSTHIQIFMRTCFLFTPPWNRIADIRGKHMFNFIRNAEQFSKVVGQILHSS